MADSGPNKRKSVTYDLSVVPLLPVELILRIFTYLPDASLRRASSVSRTFYSCAYSAGLSIPCSISLGVTNGALQLEVFRQIVQYAVPKNLALRLSIDCIPHYNVQDWELVRAGVDNKWRNLASTILFALPVLVYLSLALDNDQFDLTAPLAHRMPRLEELELFSSLGPLFERDPLPLERFTGEAPLLRRVTLWNFLLGAVPAPAFSKVTSLCITGDVYIARDANHIYAPIALAPHFPELSRLELRASENSKLEDELGLDLAGVALQWLFIDDIIPLPDLQTTLAFLEIPVVRLRCFEITTWIEPERDDDTDFALRLTSQLKPYPYNNEMLAVVVPSHRLWRRIYDVYDWEPNTSLPLAEKRGGVERLTYLRLDNAYLHAFLACRVTFPALLHIQIDLRSSSEHPALLWPPLANSGSHPYFDNFVTARDFDNPSFSDVPCTALGRLTVFALDARTIVQSREAAFLGRALGQCARPKRAKAVLALAGADFAQPEATPLLDLTFSAVTRDAFSGWHTKEDYDGGLWEDVAHIVHIDDSE